MDLTVEQTARQIAAEIVAGAPEGWTEYLLRGRGSQGGSSMSGGGYVVPSRPGGFFAGLPAHMNLPAHLNLPPHLNPNAFPHLNLHPHISSLSSAFRESHGWEGIALEFACHPSGAFELVVFRDDLEPGGGPESGWTLTVDPAFEPSEPGAAEGAEPSRRPAGDPAEAVDRLRAVLRQHVEHSGAEPELSAPVTEEQLAAAERRLGRPLPADLRALYLEADGDGGSEALAGYCWLSLAGALAERDDYIGVPAWFGWSLDWDKVVFDADPPNTVRRCSGHPGWLPFATGLDGNFLAVDLAPAADGRPGQVIEVGRDFNGGPRYVASSVTAWLGQALGLPDPHALQQTDDDSREPVVQALDERLAPDAQELHLNDLPSPADLAPLSATPHLRRLHLNRCATADLSPLAALPVEDLAVDLAAGADLAPLTGHPHLASLAVGSPAPIDLAPLRTLPALRSIDLSRCPVIDLACLAELPGLRYLALSADQWNALIAAGRLPARLAAARIAGAPSFTAALDLLAALGIDTSTAYRLSGIAEGVS
ncbi:SMI1/KNR4 family protein [Kitasatospora sp. NPDC085895]|uniref:SMI1/KNR4 family protein n=1 Tax=Kitasatospora sp. NPDC085895 TaxID=3155057 RepID=UPI00344E3498